MRAMKVSLLDWRMVLYKPITKTCGMPWMKGLKLPKKFFEG